MSDFDEIWPKSSDLIFKTVANFNNSKITQNSQKISNRGIKTQDRQCKNEEETFVYQWKYKADDDHLIFKIQFSAHPIV